MQLGVCGSYACVLGGALKAETERHGRFVVHHNSLREALRHAGDSSRQGYEGQGSRACRMLALAVALSSVKTVYLSISHCLACAWVAQPQQASLSTQSASDMTHSSLVMFDVAHKHYDNQSLSYKQLHSSAGSSTNYILCQVGRFHQRIHQCCICRCSVVAGRLVALVTSTSSSSKRRKLYKQLSAS
jgi:hypothetical protein